MNFYVSEPMDTPPACYENETQQRIYETLRQLNMPFVRVDTDDGSTMENCRYIACALGCPIVKTIFVCNRQQTKYYLYVTTDEKPFVTKEFCGALQIPRVSFAPEEALLEKLGTRIGATTLLSLINDPDHLITVVIDKDITVENYYACTDGTRNGFIKLNMEDVLHTYLSFTGHSLVLL